MTAPFPPREYEAVGVDGLTRIPANWMPLDPVHFLEHAVRCHPDKTAVIHGCRRLSYRQFHERARTAAVFRLIAEEQVTHMHGAPVVVNMLIHAPESHKRRFQHSGEMGVGGAAPPSTVIAGMAAMGFRVVHLYGTTESCGPATVCAWPPAWTRLSSEERARMLAQAVLQAGART